MIEIIEYLECCFNKNHEFDLVKKNNCFIFKKDFADIFFNKSHIPNEENNEKYRLEIISIFILNWINIETVTKSNEV